MHVSGTQSTLPLYPGISYTLDAIPIRCSRALVLRQDEGNTLHVPAAILLPGSDTSLRSDAPRW